MENISAIISHIDYYLNRTGLQLVGAVEANAILARAGLLNDSKLRKGLPLRKLLRAEKITHAYQLGGKGSEWAIPHSGQKVVVISKSQPKKEIKNLESLKSLEKARLKYKPDRVKYLLVAEAPPNSIERFFYYDNVLQHDYLFLGIAQALYPNEKEKFIKSKRNSEIKKSILEKFKSDGFYLIDLSELPLSQMKSDLTTQIPLLIQKIKFIADNKTKIILIKTTVYDKAFYFLKQKRIKNLIDCRIPFPAKGGQTKFKIKFNEALKLVGYK